MSDRYVLSLAAAAGTIAGLRMLLVRRWPARPRWPDLLILTIGVLGLVFHCGAMFFRSTFDQIPGTGSAIAQINAMSRPSQVWFAVPAILVVIALRRYLVGVLAVGFALVAVGITMYDGASLATHLTAIFTSVVALTVVVSFLVLGPAEAEVQAVRPPG